MHSPLRNVFLLAVCAAAAAFGSAAWAAEGPVTLTTEHLRVAIDETGSISSLYDLTNKVEYLADGEPAYLVSIRLTDYSIVTPTGVTFSANKDVLTFTFGQTGVTAAVRVSQTDLYVVLELVSITPAEKVNRLNWGPYPTTIKGSVGETVGVVRNDDYAIGVQGLNVKTIGQAKERKYGSALELYCNNHALAEVETVMGHKNVKVEPEKGFTMAGSKVALFGCPAVQALERIGAIEVAEGLPHPILDGQWTKVSPTATSAYMIMDFAEANIDACLEVTKKTGLKYLYHGSPFESWGHFKLRRDHFPDGVESIKRCVEKGKAMGIRLGGHTLSNFITPNDAYVTPIPDRRLSITGTSTLTIAIDAAAKEIEVATAEPFNEKQRNWMHTVRIGDELIRYGSVSDEAPWRLLNCKRGAFGTTAAAHEAGAEISKLMDHEYKTFHTNLELQQELSLRLAELFNETGLKQISFDGLEGCYSTGHGDYARMRMVADWYKHLKEKDIISDASNPGHYSWHIHTRMNWGEPWYDSFRESQQEYRLKNQAYFERNLMPRMLGWFYLRPTTSVDDMEWMLARAAGFDAGFSLCASLPDLAENGLGDEVLATIKNWETARHSKAFTCAHRKAMQDTKNEFHLEAVGPREWTLYPVFMTTAMKHSGQVLQPGQPTSTEWDFANPYEAQPMQFVLKVTSKDADADAVVSKLTFELDFAHTLSFDVSLKRNQILVCDGSGQAKVYDNHWKLLRTVAAGDAIPQVTKGDHSVVFDADFSKGASLQVEVNFKTVGNGERITGKVNPPIIQ